MEVLPTQPMSSSANLQLLLFVDKRPNSTKKIRQIQDCLKDLGVDYPYHPFNLEIVDVSEQPHLVEHFRVVATPTLIRVYPEPRQMLTGSDLISQIKLWWARWCQAVDEATIAANDEVGQGDRYGSPHSIKRSAELLRLSDEVFRLKQEQQELLEQLRFKDRLIAMLAHDLRNPLTATSIALETLEMGIDPKEPARVARLTPEMMSQLLKHARTQVKAIDRMITDVLQAAKGSGAELRIQPQMVDLKTLFNDVFHHIKRQFQPKSQTVETDIPSDLPCVYADPERVRQVLINLLDNAIKYTPTGGTIHISALHRTAQKIQVSVCDNGPGIPEENKDHIFEDRFRLERDEAKEGYGIGLALCRRIIRAHYGQIWVDSIPNHGSCFHFTLPVYRT